MRKEYDERNISIVTLAALYHHEISEGCAMEILGWSRMKIRENLDNFVPSSVPIDDFWWIVRTN